jgi:hypothetical protein
VNINLSSEVVSGLNGCSIQHCRHHLMVWIAQTERNGSALRSKPHQCAAILIHQIMPLPSPTSCCSATSVSGLICRMCSLDRWSVFSCAHFAPALSQPATPCRGGPPWDTCDVANQPNYGQVTGGRRMLMHEDVEGILNGTLPNMHFPHR